jgi:hypothetical protein
MWSERGAREGRERGILTVSTSRTGPSLPPSSTSAVPIRQSKRNCDRSTGTSDTQRIDDGVQIRREVDATDDPTSPTGSPLLPRPALSTSSISTRGFSVLTHLRAWMMEELYDTPHNVATATNAVDNQHLTEYMSVYDPRSLPRPSTHQWET